MKRTVAIFGATGAQGASVVKEALKQGMIVRAVARNADRVAEMLPEAEAFPATLDDAHSIAAALKGVDAAFLHFPMPNGPDGIQTLMTAFLEAAHEVRLPLLVYTTGGPTGDRYPSSVVVDGGTAAINVLMECGIPTIVLQPAIYLENLLPPIFVPNLRDAGILDYPPVSPKLKVQWTSHADQAKIAVAAMGRPDLAGQSFEIGTPQAITGPKLATLVARWLDSDVRFEPISPAEFGQRVGDAIGNSAAAFALTDLYGSIARLNGDEMAVDTSTLETTFGVKLTTVADHVARWPREA